MYRVPVKVTVLFSRVAILPTIYDRNMSRTGNEGKLWYSTGVKAKFRIKFTMNL
jgi:hypothetical protein